MYVGGEEHTNFAWISIQHIARSLDTTEKKEWFLRSVDEVLTPVLEAKGADWEYAVHETPRDLWKVNGLVPPPTGSEAERKWVELNRPISYELQA